MRQEAPTVSFVDFNLLERSQSQHPLGAMVAHLHVQGWNDEPLALFTDRFIGDVFHPRVARHRRTGICRFSVLFGS